MAYVTWKERKDKGIIDVVNLVAGAVPFLAPWLFGFSAEPWDTRQEQSPARA